MRRVELVELVQRILDSCGDPAVSEDEIQSMVRELEEAVPHPDVSDLIFWPESGTTTAEEVVEKALAYKPIRL